MKVLAFVASLVAGCEHPKTPPPVGHVVAPVAVPRATTDFTLVIDLSKSMEETDLPPDRIGATRDAVRGFLRKLDGDRVGIVMYGQEPKVRDPLTSDRVALDQSVAKMGIGDVPELGTALGDALALAVEQLKGSTAKRRIAIVLADGENNWVTKYDPSQAAELAKGAGITVYTVLVGNEKFEAFGGMSANPKELKAIAATTGGTFYQAIDPASFTRALDDIVARTRNR